MHPFFLCSTRFCYPKRKTNFYFKVTLMRRFKALGKTVPIIAVTHKTKF